MKRGFKSHKNLYPTKSSIRVTQTDIRQGISCLLGWNSILTKRAVKRRWWAESASVTNCPLHLILVIFYDKIWRNFKSFSRKHEENESVIFQCILCNKNLTWIRCYFGISSWVLSRHHSLCTIFKWIQIPK